MFVLKGKLAKIGVLPKYAIGWGGNVTAARGIVRRN
jgi:hypothetical protein